MNVEWEKYFLNGIGSKTLETLWISQSTKKTFDMKQYLGEYNRPHTGLMSIISSKCQ